MCCATVVDQAEFELRTVKNTLYKEMLLEEQYIITRESEHVWQFSAHKPELWFDVQASVDHLAFC